MELNSFLFLLERFKPILLLNPLYLLVVVFTSWKRSSFQIHPIQNRVFNGMKIDNIEIDLREEAAHLQQLVKDVFSFTCRRTNNFLVILPKDSSIFGGKLLCIPLFG